MRRNCIVIEKEKKKKKKGQNIRDYKAYKRCYREVSSDKVSVIFIVHGVDLFEAGYDWIIRLPDLGRRKEATVLTENDPI